MRRTNTLKYIALLGLFLLSLMVANGEEIRLRTALERDSIWLGDQIKLMIVVEQPAGTKIEFPALSDSIQKIEILKRSKIDTSKLDGTRLQLKQSYLITCFDSGAHYIPAFYFRFMNGGLRDSIKSNDLTLFVKFPPVDLKHGPVDLKKPFAAPITFKEIAPWLLAIILLAAILFLVIYAINRRNKNRPLFQRPAKPKTPPHLTAIQELDKLKEEQLWQQEKFKDYYTRLTDIVRVYIEDRFKMAAMEQTTHEIIAGFKESKESIENKSLLELKEILELADLVKFAKLTPLPDENFKMLSNAYLFVKETTIETVAEPVEAIKEEVIEPENIDVKDKKGDTQL